MTGGFDCFVGIDWSGANGRWQNGIRVAVADPGRGVPRLVSGPGPSGKWSRTHVVQWLAELAGDRRALIGFDFAFGFPPLPEGFAPAILDWPYVENHCRDDDNFYGGQFFRPPDALHSRLVNSPWLPQRDYSARYLRETDTAAAKTKGATPQSIFNAVGAAQVGPSSISGMRVLSFLRREQKGKLLIWPSEEVDDYRSVIVEIFPRYFPLSHGLSPRLSDLTALNAALIVFDSKPVERHPCSEDEGDALLSAAALRSLSADRSLLDLPGDTVRQQGWIYGVRVR